jgi:hypothetical protein
MAKSSGESPSEFLKPSLFDALKQELGLLEAMEPGSRSIGEVVSELMPLIRGCRDRGHSWVRITQSFQKYLPGMTVGALRKVAFELDPSLKGTVKGVDLTGSSEGLIPTLGDEVASEEGSDEFVESWGDGEVADEVSDEVMEVEEVSSGKKSKRSAVSF